MIIEDVKQSKIPCYVIAFFEFANFQKTIECLLKKSDLLDIRVLENYSKYTEAKFKPYILDLLKQGKVSEYVLFEKNISCNMTKVFFEKFDFNKIKSPYFMLTDGDVVTREENWLEEEIAILADNKEVFAVGIDFSLENLPAIEGSDKWIPKPKECRGKNYVEGYTGAWFLLFRTNDFANLSNYLLKKELSFVDGNFHHYCKKNKKKWARTKIAKARHLTWDNYANPDDEYNVWKASKTFKEHWYHKNYCDYTIYKKNGETL